MPGINNSEKMIPMKISYLGSRQYVDMSRIIEAFSAAINPIMNWKCSDWTDFSIRIYQPILGQCVICFGVVESDQKNAVISFFCRDQKYDFTILPVADTEISERFDEPKPDIMESVQSNNLFYFLSGNFEQYNWSYIYTQLGKYLITRDLKYDQPRACAFHALTIPDMAVVKDFAISKSYKVKGNFVILTPFYEGLSRGKISVALG